MNNQANILIAEDQDTDVYLTKWAFNKAGLSHHFTHVVDGQQAIDYLAGEPPYSDRAEYPWPDLLLLDLKMPRLTGFDVLAWLQRRPDHEPLNVVVLTSSDLQSDMAKARDLGASDYRVKPSSLDGMVQLAREIDERWLRTLARA
jgi:CheY-like chemotaxis protein